MKINNEIRDIILKRLFISLGILLLIRIGTFLPIPGINHTDLAFYIQRHSVTRNLVSTFSGDDTFVIGLFTLTSYTFSCFFDILKVLKFHFLLPRPSYNLHWNTCKIDHP